MDDGYSPFSIILFIGFILLEAAFFAFGTAIQNVNTGNLEKEAEAGNRKAQRLLKIASRPARFINSIQIVTNVIGMIIGAYMLRRWSSALEYLLARAQTAAGLWLHALSLIAVGILILVLLITFGVMIPKKCAQKEPEKWGYNLLTFISAAVVPLIPFIWIVTKLSSLILRLAGIDMNADSENVTEEDIMTMVNEGHEQGVLEASEAEMITNIFELDDKNAGDIMTHRTNLVSIDGETTLKDAITFILTEGKNSRYPVYGEDMDDIVGILHMKDALIYAEKEGRAELPISQIPGLLREPHFIPESKNIDSLFKEMQSQKIHMSLVVDEYGQIAGIVTMEDILEEIVGNILDEYDAEEEYIAVCDGGYILNGLAPLDEVGEVLEIPFSEEDSDTYDTLNGFLISKLDRIPQEGEELEVTYEGYRFQILSVENKMIRTVKAVKLPKEETEEPEEDKGRERGRQND